ncbi:hypothetical protein BD626DRAFT_541025 [Schizophyllum amplum]|uniref:Uncharacterized protein n=1 Tax=Schizophyllum amplum TaxID=97359 RepID=A0A550BW12_9AGAR|nr:hypothetical protein BD626DRAFT_541025 [Auriculariopsis ampla]
MSASRRYCGIPMEERIKEQRIMYRLTNAQTAPVRAGYYILCGHVNACCWSAQLPLKDTYLAAKNLYAEHVREHLKNGLLKINRHSIEPNCPRFQDPSVFHSQYQCCDSAHGDKKYGHVDEFYVQHVVREHLTFAFGIWCPVCGFRLRSIARNLPRGYRVEDLDSAPPRYVPPDIVQYPELPLRKYLLEHYEMGLCSQLRTLWRGTPQAVAQAKIQERRMETGLFLLNR